MIALPLNPLDLTEIYKNKADNDDFTLSVDYTKSKEVLTSKQILIYLSNTAFKCGFNTIDEELLLSYIHINFIVDAPSLDRVVSNIIKVKLGGEILDSTELFGLDDINSFIQNNEEVVESLISTISGLPIFIMETINSLDNNLTINHNLNVSRTDAKTVGLNYLNIVVNAYDAVLLTFTKRGLRSSINTSIYNTESKYRGIDLYKSLYDKGTVNQILKLLPDDIIENT
jgi:hypothetical protein